jgi:small conductance mechanosensitive channel
MEPLSAFDTYLQEMIKLTTAYAPKVLLAIAALLGGIWFINRLTELLQKGMERARFNKEIQPFLRSIANIGLKVLLVFSVAEIVGFDTTSFVAVLAAAGFAIGIALQGSLSNFASGVMIMLFRPYRVGDLVRIEDREGHVQEIQIFNTIVLGLDNRTIIIPNSMAIGGIITNLSSKGFLRIDLQVSIPYSQDFPTVKAILEEALLQTPDVLKDPAPFVGIESFDSHSIILSVRPYTVPEKYWDVYYEANRVIKETFAQHGIQVAYSEGVELGAIGK